MQKVSQSQNLLNSLPKEEASVTISFSSVLKNGTSSMLKSEIYHPFAYLKNSF